jgi:hypothetical protein
MTEAWPFGCVFVDRMRQMRNPGGCQPEDRPRTDQHRRGVPFQQFGNGFWLPSRRSFVIIHRASVDEIDDAIKREDEGEWIEAGLYGLVKVGTTTLTLALEQRQRIHAQNTKAGAAPCQRRTGP